MKVISLSLVRLLEFWRNLAITLVEVLFRFNGRFLIIMKITNNKVLIITIEIFIYILLLNRK